MFYSNAHTHSTWCDGKNTLREMTEAAIALNFSDLGFTCHSPAPFDLGCPGISGEKAYQQEILQLQAEVVGKINLSVGLEQDYYSPAILTNYDYTIGSVHYFPPREGVYRSVDDTPEVLLTTLKEWYDNDQWQMIQDYYDTVVTHLASNQNKIVGHFDLISKFNQKNPWFDAESSTYQKIASTALNQVIDIITPYEGLVEINTGAISRNWRNDPYPDQFLLKLLLERKTPVIITSDSHAVDTLTCHFNQTVELLKSIGFKESYQLKDGIFQPIAFSD